MRHARPRSRPRRNRTTAVSAVVAVVVVLVALIALPLVTYAAHAGDGHDDADPPVRTAVVPPLPTVTAPAVAAPAGSAAPASRGGARVKATPAVVPASFSFTGTGWGHGVGMSQTGALGMATEGASTTKILTHFYTGVKVQPEADDVPLAVNVAHEVHVVRVHGEALAPRGGATSITATGAHKTVRLTAGAGQTWTADATRAGMTVRQGSRTVATKVRQLTVEWAGTSSPPRHVPAGYRRHAATVVDVSTGASGSGTSHQYRYGHLTLFAHTGGGGSHLEVVNTLDLHGEYLRGLGEMPSSWPAAALRAQVDAARSYALVKYHRGIKAICDCQIDSGTGPFRDQNFVGYAKESGADGARWVAAVAATERGRARGEAVTYRGAVAQTFYFASSGGRTESSADVWGTAEPYLRSVDDHWSTETKYNPTYAKWGPQVRSESAVAAAFGLSDVVGVQLTARSDGVVLAEARSKAGHTKRLTGALLARRLQLTSVWVRGATPS